MTKFLCILTLSLTLNSLPAQASDLLDGYSYCRSFMGSGHFGQPKGKRRHCLEFSEGQMRDNASTHFGRPPKRHTYSVSGGVVTTRGGGTFELSNDGKTLTAKRGASAVAGTEFRRSKTR